jgi:hypothetical protein
MYLKIYFLFRLRGLNAPTSPTPASRALLAWTAEIQWRAPAVVPARLDTRKGPFHPYLL